MAKTGLWLFGAGGRLAGATIYSKANGQTIIRHNTTPRNPQTEAQQVQRAVMTTVTAAYVLMKSVCNHCIEGLDKAIAEGDEMIARAKLAKLGNVPEAISFSYIAKKYFGKLGHLQNPVLKN